MERDLFTTHSLREIEQFAKNTGSILHLRVAVSSDEKVSTFSGQISHAELNSLGTVLGEDMESPINKCAAYADKDACVEEEVPAPYITAKNGVVVIKEFNASKGLDSFAASEEFINGIKKFVVVSTAEAYPEGSHVLVHTSKVAALTKDLLFTDHTNIIARVL